MFKDFVAINLCNYRAIVDLASRKVCVCVCVCVCARVEAERAQAAADTHDARQTNDEPVRPCRPLGPPRPAGLRTLTQGDCQPHPDAIAVTRRRACK